MEINVTQRRESANQKPRAKNQTKLNLNLI